MYSLTEHINEHYADEAYARNQIGFFTILAILISSLGLLGTITNRVHEKKKEVGIRKILGAGAWNISLILLKATVVQMLIAILVAFPVATYLVKGYIQRFSEQVGLTLYHYIVPLIIMFILLIITTGSMLSRALKSNPVDALRYE
jgi:putative ABC transport system permease protein